MDYICILDYVTISCTYNVNSTLEYNITGYWQHTVKTHLTSTDDDDFYQEVIKFMICTTLNVLLS